MQFAYGPTATITTCRNVAAEARARTAANEMDGVLESFRKVRVVNEKEHAAAAREAEDAEQHCDSDDCRVGKLFAVEAAASDAFSTLARYETSIERSLFKNLAELRALQKAKLETS